MNRSKFFLTAALIFALGFGFSSCHKNDDEPEKNNTEQSQTTGSTSTEKPSEETSKTETFTVRADVVG